MKLRTGLAAVVAGALVAAGGAHAHEDGSHSLLEGVVPVVGGTSSPLAPHQNISYVTGVTGFTGGHVMIEGNRLYVGSYGLGMRWFDISDPADPKLLGEYLPGGRADAVPDAAVFGSRHIAVLNGTSRTSRSLPAAGRTDKSEFLDVTDAAHPKLLHTFVDSVDGEAHNGDIVDARKLWLPSGGSNIHGGLRIYDMTPLLSDPSTCQPTNNLNPCRPALLFRGNPVELWRNSPYRDGRPVGRPGELPGREAFTHTHDITVYTDYAVKQGDVYVNRDIALLAEGGNYTDNTGNTGSVFVIDITNPSSPVVLNRWMHGYTTTPLPSGKPHHPIRYHHEAQFLDGDRHVMLVTDEDLHNGCGGAGGVTALRVSHDLTRVEEELSEWFIPLGTPAAICSVHVFSSQGNLVYFGAYNAGLQVLDYANPKQPQRAGYYIAEGSTAWGAQVHGDYIYVGDMSRGLDVFKMPSSPDPVHNASLPCESLSTPGTVPRSAKNIVHLANVCGFVGTDIEFQSRTDAKGKVHDYAFVGTMGAGTRIFDITDPAHPVQAGGYFDPGWQNDVHVRGDTLVIAFDWLLVGAHLSECLKQKQIERGSFEEGGVDVVRLQFDPQTATFKTALTGCYLSSIPTGGAHTITLHPSGQWLAMNTSFAGIEVVDVRGPAPTLNRVIGRNISGDAHDVSFSRDGNTMYVASPDGATTNVGGTYVVDVSTVLTTGARQVAFIPENSQGGGANNRYNLTTTHQADSSADGKILVSTDERGGGLSQTACNTGSNGIIGGAHFYALAPINGQAQTADASPSNPKRLGTWFYPNPGLLADPLDPVLAAMGRTERGCTIHVFRNGGNGSAGPGPIHPDFDGVSRLPVDELVTAHYGAGVWHLDFGAASSSTDGITEDQFSTWANTLGWNVMPGADTWSAKEYKGYIYAGDMARGFDVYGFKKCDDLGCVVPPVVNTPGKATGGGQIEGELAELTILRGTAAGGRANFGFNASFSVGLPTGHLTFIDHGSKKDVKSTSIDSYTQTGNKATFTGRATVNGVPGVSFFVEVEDFGEPGSNASTNPDTFRLVLGDGYGAAGVLLKGNIQVHTG